MFQILVHVVVKLIDILELLLAGDLSMICDKIIGIVTTSYGYPAKTATINFNRKCQQTRKFLYYATIGNC